MPFNVSAHLQIMCCIVQAIERTKDNIVKKQALTYEEIEAEREDVSRYHVFFFFLKLFKGQST